MPTAFEFDTTHVEMGDGKFNSANRYIRKVANPADKTINMAIGKTIEVSLTSSGVNSCFAWRWRVNDATMTGESTATTTPPPDGFNTGIDGAF